MIATRTGQLLMYHKDGGIGAAAHRAPPGRRPGDGGTLRPHYRGRAQRTTPATSGSTSAAGCRRRSPRHRSGRTIQSVGRRHRGARRAQQSAPAGPVPGRPSSTARPAAPSCARTKPKAPSARWRAPTANGWSTPRGTTPAEALKLRDLATGEERWLLMDVQRDNSQGGGQQRSRPLSRFGVHARFESADHQLQRQDLAGGGALGGGDRRFRSRPRSTSRWARWPSSSIRSTTRRSTVTQIRGARPSPDGRRHRVHRARWALRRRADGRARRRRRHRNAPGRATRAG